MSTALVLVGNATRTESGSAGQIEIGVLNALKLELNVFDVAGTDPTLTVTIETSRDGIAGWRVLGQFPAVTAAGSFTKPLGDAHAFVRAKWTIGGTDPSFTFEVRAEAVQVYATKAEFLKLGLPAAALTGVTDDTIYQALISASSVATGFFHERAMVPLTHWSDDLRRATVHIAQFDVLGTKGFKPDGSDEIVIKRYDEAIAWLKLVQRGNVLLNAVDATPHVREGTMRVTSLPPRGWDDEDSSRYGEPVGNFFFEDR